MKNKVKYILFSSIISSFLLLFLFLIYNSSCYSSNGKSVFGFDEKSPLIGNKEVENAANVQDAFQKVFDLYKDSVVYISTEQTVKVQPNPFFNDPFFRDFFGLNQAPNEETQKVQGLGTGFLISDDGYICTNHHVIAKVDKVKVKVNNDTYDAKIIGSDERTDIALLKIESKDKLKPVYIGNSDDVKVGDWAIAIGNPFGLDRTFTVGVISATGRNDVDMMGSSQSHIQTDASINPGNSGGPLININGEVIGINRMIYSQSGGNIGIGFAIPINGAKHILAELKEHKKIKRGYIGVQIVPFTEEYAQQIGLKSNKGALVGSVVSGGPAGKGGLKVGDVILEAGGKTIEKFSDLIGIIDKTPIGKSLKITVWRNKSKINFFITIEERP